MPQAVWKKIQRYYHSLLASRKGIGPVNQLLLSLPDSFITRVYFDIFKPAINAVSYHIKKFCVKS